MFEAKKTKWLFPLGVKVKCKVTGLVGIIHCRCEWLNGCKRYGVQPPVDKDGKLRDDAYVDEAQIEVIKEKKVEIDQRATGGPTASNPKAF